MTEADFLPFEYDGRCYQLSRFDPRTAAVAAAACADVGSAPAAVNAEAEAGATGAMATGATAQADGDLIPSPPLAVFVDSSSPFLSRLAEKDGVDAAGCALILVVDAGGTIRCAEASVAEVEPTLVVCEREGPCTGH